MKRTWKVFFCIVLTLVLVLTLTPFTKAGTVEAGSEYSYEVAPTIQCPVTNVEYVPDEDGNFNLDFTVDLTIYKDINIPNWTLADIDCFNYSIYIPSKSEWIYELKPAIRYIIEEMYDDFVKEVADIIKVYEYIKDTKDNQVEYFKEWLKFYEDELAEEKRKADKESEKRLNIIAKMPEKVHNIMKRSALDSEDLDVVLGCMV